MAVGKYPWMSKQAIAKIETILKPDMDVFEYGSGGSTVFFKQRCARVCAVEHDPKWFDAVSNAVESVSGQHRLYLRPPAVISAPTYALRLGGGWANAVSVAMPNYAFNTYVSVLNDYCIANALILIDGRARPACCHRAWWRAQPPCVFVLDDAQRDRYSGAANFLRENTQRYELVTGTRRGTSGRRHDVRTDFFYLENK